VQIAPRAITRKASSEYLQDRQVHSSGHVGGAAGG
jgi:hypothetical protein